MTSDAKFAGLAREAEERSHSKTVAILLFAHFPDIPERLEVIVSQLTWNVPCKAVSAGDLKMNLASSLPIDVQRSSVSSSVDSISCHRWMIALPFFRRAAVPP